MRREVRGVMHYCRRIVIFILKVVLSVIPKDKKLILFSAWFGKKYADSSMYMYEYLMEHSDYRVYWYTRERAIYEQLRKEGKPTIYSKSLKAIWLQVRAIMLVSSVQLSDFNPFFLRKCIYLDLGHGFIIKQSGFDQPDTTKRKVTYDLLLRKGIDYYMAVTSTPTMKLVSRCFKVPFSNLVFCNSARLDVLFDEELRKGKNEIVSRMIAGKKVISYLPTHRSCGAVKIPVTELMDLKTIDQICEKNNAIFLIKKHFYHRDEKENVNQYRNILDITNEDIETQTLLAQSDILITDYSACYIDYLLLDRPIIFFTYDLEDYLHKERDLYFPFDTNHGGFKSQNKGELNDALEKICTEWIDVEHEEGRLELKKRYFDDDSPVGCAREHMKTVMDQLINGTYKSKWKEEEK